MVNMENKELSLLNQAIELRNRAEYLDCYKLLESLEIKDTKFISLYLRLRLECQIKLNYLEQASITLNLAFKQNPQAKDKEALYFFQKYLKKPSLKEEDAIKALQNKDYELAQKIFLKLTNTYINEPRHRYHLAICLLETNQLIDSIKHLKLCVEQNPLMQKAWYALGSIFLNANLNLEAKEYFYLGFSIDPFNQDGLACLKLYETIL